jgi:membrane fusion protein, multidrug efflux system
MMRYILSYGVALVLLLIIAGWLASGTLVQGGNGEGNGEQAIIDMIEPDSDGPVRKLFISLGLITDPNAQDPEQIGVAQGEIVSRKGAPEQTSLADTLSNETAPALQSVRTKIFSARLMPIEVLLRGKTQANATISVRAETSGLVKQLHVSKGQNVEPGDLLCTLDRGTREARLAQTEASLAQADVALAQAQANLETNKTLRDKGLSAANTARQFEVSLTAAQASRRAALAALDDARNDLDNTEIRAEIGGIVQDPIASVGDMLLVGGVCATVVELDPMLFVGKVAETKIALVKAGLPAIVTTVTGQVVEGRVRYVSASADSATRAFAVEVELDNANGALLDGVTAEAVVRAGATKAQFVPQSVLTLATSGTLGVQIVENGAASFRPVQILGDEAGGVWVAGLPPSAEIITLGQEYVRDGQLVAATRIAEGTN